LDKRDTDKFILYEFIVDDETMLHLEVYHPMPWSDFVMFAFLAIFIGGFPDSRIAYGFGGKMLNHSHELRESVEATEEICRYLTTQLFERGCDNRTSD
jgi:hypothetical protein